MSTAKKKPAAKRTTAKKATAAKPTKTSDDWTVSFQKLDYTVATVLGVARFYFRAGTKDVQAAAAKQFDRWQADLDAMKWPWWRRYDREEWQKVDGRTPGVVAKYLEGAGKDSRGLRLIDLPEPETNPDRIAMHARTRELEVVVHGRGGILFSSRASLLQAMIPSEELQRHAEAWLRRTLDVCETLPVQSGVVGFVLNEGTLRTKDKAVDRRMRELLASSPTIDIAEDLTDVLVKPDRIRGVGWLTVLGTDAEKVVGGEARLRRELPRAVVLHRTKHALVVQAGPRPVLGDGALDAYRDTHRALERAIAPVVALLTPEGKALFTRLG